MNPCASIILPVYNGEKYISYAIESILQQSFADFELIIINDGSTDKTSSIISKYKSTDNRILRIDQQNRGLIKTLNRGILTAKGKYIVRHDADDISLPHRLKTQIDFLEKNEAIGFVGCLHHVINSEGVIIRTQRIKTKKQLLHQLHIGLGIMCHGTAVIRRNVLITVKGYRNKIVHAEDYDLWWRLHLISDFHIVPVPLYKYREDVESISFTKMIPAVISVSASCTLYKERLATKKDSYKHLIIDEKKKCAIWPARYPFIGDYFYILSLRMILTNNGKKAKKPLLRCITEDNSPIKAITHIFLLSGVILLPEALLRSIVLAFMRLDELMQNLIHFKGGFIERK